MESYDFGKLICKLRKEKGLTQLELSQKMFITDKAVSKWERGLSFPDISLLKSLSEIFDVSVAYLLGIEEKDNNKINEEKLDLRVKEEIEKYEKKKKEKLKKVLIECMIIAIFSGIIIYLIVSHYIKYHPSQVYEGENLYSMEYYDLEQFGLDRLKDIIQNSQNISEKYTVAFFKASLDNNGYVKSFTLSLNKYNSKEEYQGTLGYTYEDNKLYYDSNTNGNEYIVKEYNRNCEFENISELIKKIPIKNQINLSTLKYYTLSYNQTTILQPNLPIIDMRLTNKDALSFDDYQSGKGGLSDSDDVISFILGGIGSLIEEEKYIYVFEKTYKSESASSSYFMETDYHIDIYNRLKFTRDYGRTWIYTDLSQNEVKDTLNLYNSLSLLDNSWYISSDKNMPIAFFYGKEPILKISFDNGNSWERITFEFPKEKGALITKRVVGCTSKNVIYVALGTDFSTKFEFEEIKKMYISTDCGKTFKEKELPRSGSSNTLIDLCMFDEKNGVLVLENTDDINMPLIYATKNGGDSFEEVKFSYFNLPDEIKYLIDIDSITKEGEYYIITLGQGSQGSLKVEFKTNDLQGKWNYNKMYRKTIHTVE